MSEEPQNWIEENEEETVLLCIKDAIEDRDLETIKDCLLILDIQNANDETVRSIMYFVVTLAFQNQWNDLVFELNFFVTNNCVKSGYYNAYFFSEPTATTDILQFYFDNNKRTFEDYILDLFLVVEEHILTSTIYPLSELSTGMTLERFDALLARLYLESEQNLGIAGTLEDILKELKSEYSTITERPSYIIPQKDGKTLSEQELFDSAMLDIPPFNPPQTTLTLKDKREFAKILAAKEYEADRATTATVSHIFGKIFTVLQDMSDDMYYKIHTEFHKRLWELDLQNNDHLFRIFGPCHPTIREQTLDSISDNICDRYGGCRMMTCVEHETDDDEGITDEWFTGVCERCSRQIEKKCDAKRVLLNCGGFKGCFCGNDLCVVEYCNEVGMIWASKTAIKAFDTMKEIGIYDRTYPFVEETLEDKMRRLDEARSFIDYCMSL